MSKLASVAAIQEWCPWCADHMQGGGWGMMFFWTISLLILILAIWSIAFRRRRPDEPEGTGGSDEDRAESLLRERYAQGEIDEDEYRNKLDELKQSR